MQCSYCDEPSVISFSDYRGLKHVCQRHYKIKLIEDIEKDELVRPICEKCGQGVLLYQTLGLIGESVIVSFICSQCSKNSTVKKEIESYFKSA